MKYILEDISNLTEAMSFGTNTTSTFDPITNYKDLKAEGKILEFWDQYYKECWGDNGEFVRTLGEPFRIELTTLGFSSAENPFVSFIMEVIKSHELIKKALETKPAAYYGSIHNAFIGKLITAEMLRNKALPKISKDNVLIWVPALYTYSPNDFSSYLQLERDYLEHKISVTGDDGTDVATGKENEIFATAFSSDNDAFEPEEDDFLTKLKNGTATLANKITSGTLRNISTLRVIINQLTGGQGGKLSNLADPTEEKIIDSFKAWVTSADKLKSIINFILLSTSPADYTTVVKACQGLKLGADDTVTNVSAKVAGSIASLADMQETIKTLATFDTSAKNRILIVTALAKYGIRDISPDLFA